MFSQFQLIDSCHGDPSIKGRDFTEVIILKLTSLPEFRLLMLFSPFSINISLWCFIPNMDPTIQAELERQQSTMLEKLSSIMDNKSESVKRQAEESSNMQISELEKISLSEPRNFKKKGHEQQYKHNEQVAKDAVVAGKNEACIAKLNESIDLIDSCQKLILKADKSDYGWKTVGEYLDNELADDDQDTKIMKKADKETQWKIAESHPAKAMMARLWFRNPRSLGNTIANSSPSPSPFSLSTGSYSPRFSCSTEGPKSIGSLPFSSGMAPK